MSSPDFRAELQLLFDAAKSFVEPALGHHRPWTAALDRARAALAEPQQGAPSDEEWDTLVERLWDQYETAGYQGERFMYCSDFGTACGLLREELTHYGAQAVPVAVAERLPGEGDLKDGRCWFWFPYDGTTYEHWVLGDADICTGLECAECTHWLPHWALPLPEAQP
jgi:hypothetical protein